jgi:membrane protein YdbS with pleckstrin-like domain
MKVFKSAVSVGIFLPPLLIAGIVISLQVYSGNCLGSALLLPIIAFMVHLFMTTTYTIQGNALKVKAGFLFRRTIDITSIKKIEETRNPMSAPAASLDRLDIQYGSFDNVIVSPKDKAGFIEALCALNPAIKVQYRNK